MNNLILWGGIALSAVVMLIFYGRSYAPVRSALKGMFTGALALAAVYFLGGYIGLSLPLNIFNITIALILGVPGVIILVLTQIFL